MNRHVPLLLSIVLVACGSKGKSAVTSFANETLAPVALPTEAPTGAASAAPTVAPAPAVIDLGAAGHLATDAGASFQFTSTVEAELVESEANRDPFRSFASRFIDLLKRPAGNQRVIILGQYSLDELKLIAIVQSGDFPRAMFLDPAGKGWVVRPGDYVARSELAHAVGSRGNDYELNWRVDRIRDGDVVFVREDPGQPGVPPLTRVIPLYQEVDPQSGTYD